MVVRIHRLKKDGSADRSLYLPVLTELLLGNAVIMPVDGVYGVAAIPSRDETAVSASSVPAEILINDLASLSSHATFSKQEYDFLHRVWPDEITVMLAASGKAGSVYARMPASPVARDIIAESGGILFFSTLAGKNGKAVSGKKDLLQCAGKCGSSLLIIDEWCKSHVLPTVIDIRGGKLALVRKGKVSLEEIQSLFFLGSGED